MRVDAGAVSNFLTIGGEGRTREVIGLVPTGRRAAVRAAQSRNGKQLSRANSIRVETASHNASTRGAEGFRSLWGETATLAARTTDSDSHVSLISGKSVVDSRSSNRTPT